MRLYMQDIPRYCRERPLPPYSYVPALNPHPMSDPRGHSSAVGGKAVGGGWREARSVAAVCHGGRRLALGVPRNGGAAGEATGPSWSRVMALAGLVTRSRPASRVHGPTRGL